MNANPTTSKASARGVYLDHNATTPLRPEAREAMLSALAQPLGNPSSAHGAGRAARALLDMARERVARALAVDEDEVVFTSGGTESDQLAIFGALLGADPARRGMVTTAIEHSAVLSAARALERRGHPLRIVPVDAEGFPDAGTIAVAARECAAGLVSVQAVNSELATILDLRAIAAAIGSTFAPESRPALHTDAVQALGRIELALDESGFDLASFSAHKVGGPQGVGVLWVRSGTRLPGIVGGAQEGGRRPGTENVPAIVGAAVAIELAVGEREAFAMRSARLVERLWTRLSAVFPAAVLLGPPLGSSRRAPHTLDVALPGVDGRVLVTRLDLAGLQASAGAACQSGSLEPSHVLLAVGLDPELARSGLRLSVGRETSEQDVDNAVDILRTTLSSAR